MAKKKPSKKNDGKKTVESITHDADKRKTSPRRNINRL